MNKKIFLIIYCIFCLQSTLQADNNSIFDSIPNKTTNLNQDIKQTCKAQLVLLNKITAKSHKVFLNEGDRHIFYNLHVNLKKSFRNNAKKEYGALIIASEQKFDEDVQILFDGWLISPNQYVSTLNHPIYEILLLDCK